jgi:hypothetical protein
VLANNAVVRIDNAGCVSRLEPGGGAPTLRQVMTFHVGLLDVGNQFGAVTTRAIYNCNAVACMSNELLTGAGVAFTTGSEPRLVITSVDATGVVLAQVVMVPDTQSRDLFVERARLPAAAPPDQLVVGQFDTDSRTDLFWALSGRRGTSFETAYARLVAGQPLEAISEPQTVNLDAIYAGDLTGEGRDDIAITGTIATLQGVAILPMNLMSPVITIPTDPICPR